MKTLMENWRGFLTEAKKTKVTGPGQKRVSKKIAHLIDDEGKDPKQAAAIAYSMEERGELKEEEDPLNESYGKIESLISQLKAMEGLYVGVSVEQDLITVRFVDETGAPAYEFAGYPQGFLHIRPQRKDYDGPCRGSWVVSVAKATKGWGPLLYDVAIELASNPFMMSKLGVSGYYIGLTPDRVNLSADAYKVWKKYKEIRPDIKQKQLDDLYNTLTDNPVDNCEDDSAQTHAGYYLEEPGEDDEAEKGRKVDFLQNSPVMQVYVKSGTPALDRLASIKRIKVKKGKSI